MLNLKKFFINIICCFIASKQLRHKIRNSVNRKSSKDIILEISNKLDKCIEEINNLEILIKYTKNVNSLEPAIGNKALVQKATVAILAHFSIIAKKYNLKYWLDSGTLIGYLRHNGGFIPWDDDIDICMERSDYEKLVKIKEELNKDGFFYQVGEITRLYYRNLHVWVDIFPMDIGNAEIPPTGETYKKFISKLNDIKSAIDFDYIKWQKHKKPVSQTYLDTCYYRRDTELVKKKIKKGFVFYGVETNVRTRVLFNNATIFPLKPVKFFGIDAYIPQNADLYLFQMYGDYMNWPKDFKSYHGCSLADNMSYDSYVECQELINKYYPLNKKDR